MKIIVASSVAFVATFLLIIYFNFFDIKNSRAFSSGDYRTSGSGEWDETEIWEVFDGEKWNPAMQPPGEDVHSITITANQKLVISNETILNNINIEEGAELSIEANTLTCSKVSGKGGITCNGKLNLGTSILEGNGDFIVGSKATLMIGSDAGIDKKGAQGNIQLTGKKEYNKEAIFYFNGTVKQHTGNGLPVILKQLVIDNPSGVELDQNIQVQEQLTLTKGVFQSGAHVLTLGSSTLNTCRINISSGSLSGNIKIWFGQNNFSNLNFALSDLVNEYRLNFTSDEPVFQKGMVELTYNNGIPDDSQKSPFAARQVVVAITPLGYFSAMLSNGADEAVFQLGKIESGANMEQLVNWKLISKNNTANKDSKEKSISNILYGPPLFDKTLVVRFYSEQKTMANFQMTNSKGKSVKMETMQIQQGFNQFVFESSDQLTPGSYLVQISNPSEIHTFKVMCGNQVATQSGS